ncbi:MAG: methyltransferase type 11 [Clostridiales bacterium]|nr:methyltransferase type 11 [Clostridiales bacterium]
MANPWEEIRLEDYENHMSLDSVRQLQAMNALMKAQFGDYPVSSAMVLGIAGGNGLEHVDPAKYQTVYGVDINDEYLRIVESRYPELSDVLKCLRVELINESDKLPHADLIIANLLVEYIGYDVFKNAVATVMPQFVSCVIQINENAEQWVSDSPYIHAFDRLDEVHHQMDEDCLEKAMGEIGYSGALRQKVGLPNGKALVRMDFRQG